MIAAIVPAKSLDAAKERLSALLTPAERRGLSLAMLRDAVAALKTAREIARIAVVSPDRDVLEPARQMGVLAIEEPETAGGLNRALQFALERLVPRPEALVVLLADVPGITTERINAATHHLRGERAVVIGPSGDGGTALLAQKPAGIIPFRFGPGSAEAHRRAAIEAGIEPAELDQGVSTLDIDSPDDLHRFLREQRDTETRRFLISAGIAERLGKEQHVG